MNPRYLLSSLSDDDLVARLTALVRQERCVLADVLAHIAEVDARRIYLVYGCSSMYVYCTELLGLSEAAAYMRIRAARLARTWPQVLEDIADGRLSLSGLNVLAPHVGPDGALIEAARGLSTRAIKELVAGANPAPDVPDAVTPVAEDRVVIRFTASTRFRDKLEEARALLSHSVPDGTLEEVLERALDAVIERTKKRRFAETDAPRAARPSGARTRHVPAEVTREVNRRDDGRCTFVGVNGRRCNARAFVQIHHDDAYARDGDHTPENLRITCAAHNRHLADEEFGREYMEKVSGQLGSNRAIRTPERDTPADAQRALVNLGFTAGPARGALSAAVAARGRDASIQDLVAAALPHLT